MDLRPFRHEVHQGLGLDGGARGVRDALSHQLEGPFCYSTLGLGALNDFAEGEFGHHRDGVGVEVVSEFLLRQEHYVD